ncbi:hypothetical protein GCM10027320_24610 [Massilia solisilvae]
MSMNKRIFGAVPALLALLLAGCGGGGDAKDVQIASQKENVPVPQALDTAAFIKLAQGETCADQKNRLWLIDGKQVFWDRASARCPDNSYSRKLFGATPDALLCSTSDSIAGPQTSCANDTARALFDTVQKNLEAPNLGLDASHKVEPIPFQYNGPVLGTAMPFTTLAKESNSAITRSLNVVIRDQSSFAQLWADNYANNSVVPPMPAVDFSQNMVIGVFLGDSSVACGGVAIVDVLATKTKVTVDYERRHAPPDTACIAVVEHQMHLVTVARSDAPVEFVAHDANAVPVKLIDFVGNSGVQNAREVVVKDAASWAALWSEHAGKDKALPAVDFSKQMVVGVFLGPVMSCESLRLDGATNDGKQIRVSYTHMLPPMGVMCIATVAYPSQLFVIDRSDLPVVFTKETMRPGQLGH